MKITAHNTIQKEKATATIAVRTKRNRNLKQMGLKFKQVILVKGSLIPSFLQRL